MSQVRWQRIHFQDQKDSADVLQAGDWFSAVTHGRRQNWTFIVSTAEEFARRLTYDGINIRTQKIVRPAVLKRATLVEIRQRIESGLDKIAFKIERERRGFGVMFRSKTLQTQFGGRAYYDPPNAAEVVLKTVMPASFVPYATDFVIAVNPPIEVVFAYDPDDDDLKSLIVADLRERLSTMAVGMAYGFEEPEFRYIADFAQSDVIFIDDAEWTGNLYIIDVA